MRLDGNTVLITGGSTGIGLAMAEAFLDAGSRVVVCGRRQDRLDEAQEHRAGLATKVCDVSVAAEREALAAWMLAEFGEMNVLVNNAGIQRDIDFSEGLSEYLGGDDEIAINLKAPIELSGLFIPHLRGRPDAAIVNVSSGLGFVPAAKMPVYSATKAALHAYTMALRHQLKRLGIQVFEVVPPAVDTGLNPEGRARRGGYKPDLKPKEFVDAVMKGLEAGIPEIGYGPTLASLKASREELDAAFERMNGGWR